MGEPEAAWAMDRGALLRASDSVLISLTEDYEAAEGGGDTAATYIGHGNKMAVDRASLV